MPDWLWTYLGVSKPGENERFTVNGQDFVVRGGIPRSLALVSSDQGQTRDTFQFKWSKKDSYESAASTARMHKWLRERYGEVTFASWLTGSGQYPLLIDAGCGSGMSGFDLFGAVVPPVRYLGIDISPAVDIASDRFSEKGHVAAFMQADIGNLPFPAESVDVVFSEGVLHHTRSTESSLRALVKLIKPGGRFLFYVYRRKGPIREFSDDYIRGRLQQMAPVQAWKAVESLTRLGIALGQLNGEIDVPEPVELLEIPAGRVDVQRLFYWHVAKAFYSPDLTFDEMNHINFDWYAPAYAHRQSPDEVKAWCRDAGLEIEREVVEEAGITVVARKRS